MHSNITDGFSEVGGYFGLHLPEYNDPFPNMLKFQSGRAALRAVLECTHIKQVFLPIYICDAVVQAVVDSGVVIKWYVLDDSLYPKYLPNLISKDCAVLYVNYFGLCDSNVERLLLEISKNQLIIDNSQALFAQPTSAMATIYSTRKFIGAPDGGLLAHTELAINMPENEDIDSLGRMRALLLRMAGSARAGYQSYIEAEKTLNNTKPLKMSRLTNRILASINMDVVKRRRRENFLELTDKLETLNEYNWRPGSDSIPLCYPVLIDRNVDNLRDKLAEKGIFIPTYWRDIESRVTSNSIESRLLHCCLFVPCDQRYSVSDMSNLAKLITAVIEGEE